MQVVRMTAVLDKACLQMILIPHASVACLKIGFPCCVDLLDKVLPLERIRSAQRGVAIDDSLECGAEDVDADSSVDANYKHRIVDRSAWLQARQVE